MEIKSEEDFNEKVLKSDKPVLVDFWAPWCGPCHMVSPIVEELGKDYANKMMVCKMNVDEVPVVAQQYRIMSIPTIALFKEGEVAEQVIGALPRKIIEDKIKPHIE
jgi:thioredoxin 1